MTEPGGGPFDPGDRAPEPRRHPGPPRVLVVDDFEDTRIILSEAFTAAGFEVFAAGDAEEAIATARRVPPDAVVLDLTLQNGLDGLGLASVLAAESDREDLPIVAFTARHPADVEEAAHQAGCCDVIEKPARPEKVIAAVRRALAAPHPAVGGLPHRSPTAIRLRRRFLEHLPARLAEIEAVAVPGPGFDPRTALQRVHRLAGSAALHHLPEVRARARNLEQLFERSPGSATAVEKELCELRSAVEAATEAASRSDLPSRGA